MTHKRWIQITLAALIISMLAFGEFLPAQAEDLLQENNPALSVVSLEDCLRMAEVDNLGIRRTRLGVNISLLDRIRAESVFDPGFEADFSGRRSGSSAFGSADSTQIDFALRYRLPTWQGGMWVLSMDQSRSSGSQMIGDTPAGYTTFSSNVGLSYSMALMEGRGERINRIGVVRADLAVARSEAATSEAARSIRHGVVQAYINAVLAARAIEVSDVSLANARNLVEEVQARIDVGQLAEYELLAAQAGLAEREENLLNAGASLSIALDSLKELIGLPLRGEIEIDPETIRPVMLDVNADNLFLLAQQNRPDLREIDLRISQANLDLLLAGDRRQASLRWNSVFGLNGQGDGYTDSFEDMSNFSWYTGLEYSLPLGGNRSAEADYSSVRISLESLDLERTNFLRVLQRNIRTAVEDLNNAILRTDVRWQGLQVQEVKMESERTRLSLGLITSRDMLEFDLEYASAKLGYDQALADAMLAVAGIEYLINKPMLADAISLSGIYTDGNDGNDGEVDR